MSRRLLKAFRLAAILYLILCILPIFFQNWILFPGSAHQGDPSVTLAHLLPGEQLIPLTAPTGEKITALFGPALLPNGRPDPQPQDRPTLLYFYGNGSLIVLSDWEFDHFRRLGVNVLIPDYLGYGMSGGKPSEAALYATADACYDYLLSHHTDPHRLIIAGWSLGGAVAIDLAVRRPSAGLIVFSTFTNLRAMARKTFPFLPNVYMPYHFDSLEKIPRLSCPLLICNGLLDTVIPPAMSDALAAAAHCSVTRLKISSADHNTIFTASPQQLLPVMQQFLQTACPKLP